MILNKHFKMDGVHIFRKRFDCRECGKPCNPSGYKELKGGYLFAISYGCLKCDINYVNNIILS